MKDNMGIPKESDLVLEYSPDEPNSCQYYLVDHEYRVIFWLHEHDLTDCINVRGAKDDAHISKCRDKHLLSRATILIINEEYLLENHYWYGHVDPRARAGLTRLHHRSHCELFPNRRIIDDYVFDQLQGIVTQSTLGE